MKFIPNLFFCLFAALGLTAQEKISQLRSTLEGAKNEKEKVEAYRSLVDFYASQNADSAAWYGDRAIAFAREKKYEVGEAIILSRLSVMDESRGRIDEAESRGNKALAISRRNNYLMGVASAYHNLGSLEASRGNYDLALKYFVSALKTYDSVDDPQGRLLTYLNLGNLYLEHGDTASAWKDYRLAEQISEKTPLTNATVSLHNTLGAMFADRGSKDTALRLFKLALTESDKPAFIQAHVESLLCIGEFYFDQGNIPTATTYVTEGIEAARKYNLPEMEANLQMEAARIKEKSEPARALPYLERAKALCEQIKSKSFLAGVYAEIATVQEKLGNYKEALAAQRAQKKLNDSLFSIDKTREIASINASYQLETDKRITKSEALSRYNRKQRNELVFIASCLAGVLVILLLYFMKTRKLNKQLTRHEKQLEEINSMKDKIFSVIGHDLRGPIARIPVALEIIDDNETSPEEKKFLIENLKEHSKVALETFDKLLYWGRSLVKGVSINQQMMPTRGYIREGIELRKIKAAEKTITITDNTPANLEIYSDPSIFDFVMRNLLANALKYTPRDGKIEINADATQTSGRTVFSVRDTGIGISREQLPGIFSALKSRSGTENEKGHGIGLMLCKEFAQQNGGDLWVESEPGKGSTFYFSVRSRKES